MSGWVILFGLGALVLLLLWWPGRIGRPMLMLAAAAVFVAAAGYAWQGVPGEPGAPAQRDDHAHRQPDSLFSIERQTLLDRFGESSEWLATADGLDRWGEKQAAVSFMAGAVARHPNNVSLRLGLAHALLTVASGNITAPAVKLAYDRAIAVAGAKDPSARYFYGLAWLEAGAPDRAAAIWKTLDASLPTASPWRGVIESRLRLVDMLMAQQARMAAGGH